MESPWSTSFIPPEGVVQKVSKGGMSAISSTLKDVPVNKMLSGKRYLQIVTDEETLPLQPSGNQNRCDPK